MKKIPTLFARTGNRRHVIDQITPGCEWVANGEGVATRKWDGTCIRISHVWIDGPQVAVEARREVKPGTPPPPNFAVAETDPVTGKTFGWEPYAQSGFAKFILEALPDEPDATDWPEGTYELCGPKINGNPEHFATHVLLRHGYSQWSDCPRDFGGLRQALLTGGAKGWEGIVFWHPDGRKAKIKGRDFDKGPT